MASTSTAATTDINDVNKEQVKSQASHSVSQKEDHKNLSHNSKLLYYSIPIYYNCSRLCICLLPLHTLTAELIWLKFDIQGEFLMLFIFL